CGCAGRSPARGGRRAGPLPPGWQMINPVCRTGPGPREPRYVLGRRIVGIHPIVPLFEGLGLGFAILSYADQISIAASADPAQVADVEAITDAIATEFDALVDAVGLNAPVAVPAPRGATVRVTDLMTATVQTVSPA